MTVVVVDAATVVDLLCDFPAAEEYRHQMAAASAVAVPAHLDAEVLSALGRLKRAGRLTRETERVDALAAFPARRWPLRPLLGAAWELTDRIAVRDALYLALAVSLDATLVSSDGRLRSAAAGIVDVAEPDEAPCRVPTARRRCSCFASHAGHELDLAPEPGSASEVAVVAVADGTRLAAGVIRPS